MSRCRSTLRRSQGVDLVDHDATLLGRSAYVVEGTVENVLEPAERVAASAEQTNHRGIGEGTALEAERATERADFTFERDERGFVERLEANADPLVERRAVVGGDDDATVATSP